jgi:succinate dehydrogenase/fumarate reductase cytochrome b subunit
MIVNQLFKHSKTISYTVKSIHRITVSALLMTTLIIAGTATSKAAQEGKAQAQQTVQSVVAKQAALVTEFDVNGLKVLLKEA